jgi:chemotaxis protein MotA
MWQPIPLVMILLGSIAAVLISFRFKRVMTLILVFLRRLGGYNRRNNRMLIAEIIHLSRARRQSIDNYVAARRGIRDFFLRDSAMLFEWAQAEITGPQLRDLLFTRSETIYRRYIHEAKIFSRISVFPALIGGLITLFSAASGLSAFDDDGSIGEVAEVVGKSLIPFVYGCLISVIVLRPIAENLAEASEEEHTARMIVVEGIMMIFENLPPQFVQEKVMSFILPTERMEMLQKQ